jgi:hypothetical protein
MMRHWALSLCALAACTDLGIVGRVCPAGRCDAAAGSAARGMTDAGSAQPPTSPQPTPSVTVPIATASDAGLDAASGGPSHDAGPCDPASTDCARCASDWDCGNNVFYPVCDLASSTCVECADSAQETDLRLRVIRNCLSLLVPLCVLMPVDTANNTCWVEECGNRCSP